MVLPPVTIYSTYNDYIITLKKLENTFTDQARNNIVDRLRARYSCNKAQVVSIKNKFQDISLEELIDEEHDITYVVGDIVYDDTWTIYTDNPKIIYFINYDVCVEYNSINYKNNFTGDYVHYDYNGKMIKVETYVYGILKVSRMVFPKNDLKFKKYYPIEVEKQYHVYYESDQICKTYDYTNEHTYVISTFENNSIINQKKYKRGNLDSDVSFENRKLNGITMIYYPCTGKIFKIIHYKDNLLHGEYVDFFRNGRSIYYYVNNELHGKYCKYNSDNRLLEAGQYENNMKVGVWYKYINDVQFKLMHYNNDVVTKHAIHSISHENSFKEFATYENGYVNRLVHYDSSGSIDYEEIFDKNTLIERKEYNKFGMLKNHDKFNIGKQIEYLDDGGKIVHHFGIFSYYNYATLEKKFYSEERKTFDQHNNLISTKLYRGMTDITDEITQSKSYESTTMVEYLAKLFC